MLRQAAPLASRVRAAMLAALAGGGVSWRLQISRGEFEVLVDKLSPCITTAKIEESRDFYVRHFDARIAFDCGWYVNLEFGNASRSLQFMHGPPASQAPSSSSTTNLDFASSDVEMMTND